MDDNKSSKQRAFSLLKTIGSTAVKAGSEALRKKLNLSDTEDISFSLAALRLTKGLDELKGAAMKIGQIMSMMDENLLPKGWKEALSKLQAEATPRDWKEIEPILLQEYGSLEAFSHIEKQSVHAASIAQVHCAILKDGTKVAVKVQYPDLEKNIKSDLNSMKKLIKIANIMPNMANYDHLFSAAEEMFKQELDFNREKNFYKLYINHFKNNQDILVPKPIDNLCTKKILVMEWVEGTNLQKWINLQEEKIRNNKDSAESADARNKVGELMLDVIFREILLLQYIQSDPNPGNFLITEDNKLVLLDFGATQKLSPELVENYVLLCQAGIKQKRSELLQIAKKMKFIEMGDSDEVRDSFVKIINIALEPFMNEIYSWDNCLLTKRINSESFFYMKNTKYRAPQGEVLFMNRRLAGNLMMMEKLGCVFSAKQVFLRILKEREEIC